MVKIHINNYARKHTLGTSLQSLGVWGEGKKASGMYSFSISIIQASNVSVTSESFAGDTVVTSQVKTGN